MSAELKKSTTTPTTTTTTTTTTPPTDAPKVVAELAIPMEIDQAQQTIDCERSGHSVVMPEHPGGTCQPPCSPPQETTSQPPLPPCPLGQPPCPPQGQPPVGPPPTGQPPVPPTGQPPMGPPPTGQPPVGPPPGQPPCPPMGPPPTEPPPPDNEILDDESKWFTCIVGESETAFRKHPPTFTLATEDPVPNLPGHYLSITNPLLGEVFVAGKLSVLSISEMEKLVAALPTKAPAPEAPATTPDTRPMVTEKDLKETTPVEFQFAKESKTRSRVLNVGNIQAHPDNKFGVFQAASNFNAVESPSDSRSPDVATFTEEYVYDNTQGPAASISAGAAAIARVHAAFFSPDCKKVKTDTFRQTADKQIELLGDLSKYFTVKNGYVVQTGKETSLPNEDTPEYRDLLGKGKVALHSAVEITFGASEYGSIPIIPHGQFIDQVFCAAMNVGQGQSGYKNSLLRDAVERIRFILRIAYEGTYLAAILNQREQLFLTLIGGGVFNNPRDIIWDVIAEVHNKWVNHPACKLKVVKVNMWSSPPSTDIVSKFQRFQIPVIISEIKSTGIIQSKL